ACSCCFFFSSRRRHTRFSRDWSSDVCSSDLAGSAGTVFGGGPAAALAAAAAAEAVGGVNCSNSEAAGSACTLTGAGAGPAAVVRSEERRVGKEGRARWAPCPRQETRTLRRCD